mmetsp:Transcript_38762/g.102977  ORF Transcript_38762/g.102977 Transcript_38762/m.102977 type:complete len:235 (+) Transcript_38762:300-1004(+)
MRACAMRSCRPECRHRLRSLLAPHTSLSPHSLCICRICCCAARHKTHHGRRKGVATGRDQLVISVALPCSARARGAPRARSSIRLPFHPQPTDPPTQLHPFLQRSKRHHPTRPRRPAIPPPPKLSPVRRAHRASFLPAVHLNPWNAPNPRPAATPDPAAATARAAQPPRLCTSAATAPTVWPRHGDRVAQQRPSQLVQVHSRRPSPWKLSRRHPYTSAVPSPWDQLPLAHTPSP